MIFEILESFFEFLEDFYYYVKDDLNEKIQKTRKRNQLKKYLNTKDDKVLQVNTKDEKVLQAKNKLIKKLNKKYNIKLDVSDLDVDKIEYVPYTHLTNDKFIMTDYKLTPEQFLNCLDKGIVYLNVMDEYNKIIGEYEYSKEIKKIYTIKSTPFKYIKLTQKDLKIKGFQFKLINKYAKLDEIDDIVVMLLKQDSLKLIVDDYYLNYMLNNILKKENLKQRLLKNKHSIHVIYNLYKGWNKDINDMLDDIGKNFGVENLTKQFVLDYVELPPEDRDIATGQNLFNVKQY